MCECINVLNTKNAFLDHFDSSRVNNYPKHIKLIKIQFLFNHLEVLDCT